MNIRTVNQEVFQAEGSVLSFGQKEIDFIRKQAAENTRGRARICAHPGPEERMQEMLVALRNDVSIRPHYHPGNVESFYCMYGEMTVYLFRDDGSLLETVAMGDIRSGKQIYYRQTVPIYHSLIVESDVVVFQEVTQGPFRRENTVLAPWAPEEGVDGKLEKYIDELRLRSIEPGK